MQAHHEANMDEEQKMHKMRRKLEKEIIEAKKPFLIYQFGEAECIECRRRWTSGAIHVQRIVQAFRFGGR